MLAILSGVIGFIISWFFASASKGRKVKIAWRVLAFIVLILGIKQAISNNNFVEKTGDRLDEVEQVSSNVKPTITVTPPKFTPSGKEGKKNYSFRLDIDSNSPLNEIEFINKDLEHLWNEEIICLDSKPQKNKPNNFCHKFGFHLEYPKKKSFILTFFTDKEVNSFSESVSIVWREKLIEPQLVSWD